MKKIKKLKKPVKNLKTNIALYGGTNECLANDAATDGNCNC